MWKSVFQVFKFQILNSKCVKESSSKCPRIFKVCEREFFKLLKALSFKCVKEVLCQRYKFQIKISNLCKKFFQVFEGFL
jgi:hypothetical protein